MDSRHQIRLNNNNLVSSGTTCLIIALVISTSTGFHIRRLIVTSCFRLIGFTVGFFWLIGDLLPCFALLWLINKLIIERKQEQDIKVIYVKGIELTLKEVIIIIFIWLYFIELVLVTSCSIGKRDDCETTLIVYKNIFFHIQVYIAVIYLLKPWTWTKIDLREFLAIIGKILISYSSYMDCVRSKPGVSQNEEHLENPKSDTKSASKISKSANTTSTNSRSKEANRKQQRISRSTITTRSRSRRRPVSERRARSRTTTRTRPRSSSVKILQNARNLVRVQVFK